MTDPPRLLDGGDELTADELRALESDFVPAPGGAKRAVWAALAVQLAVTGTATVATGAAGGAAGFASTTTLTTLALLKSAGVGVALGAAVSTGLFFSARHEVAPPAASGHVTSAPAAISAPPAEPPRPAVAEPPVAPEASNEIARTAPSPVPIEQPRSPAPMLEGESQRVARARALLRAGDALRALRTLRELEQDEPQGLLAQEREALLIEALATLGQRDSARERAATFLARYPKSPHAAAVRRAAQ